MGFWVAQKSDRVVLGCVQQVLRMGVQKWQQYIQYVASPKVRASAPAFKSKQTPRGRRGGASCTLCYMNCFLQKPLRTTKSSHPLDCTCRKGFLHKQWSRTAVQ